MVQPWLIFMNLALVSRMAKAPKKAMTLLLAIMLAVSALMPALGWAELSTSRAVCACCQVDGQSCPTRSCCSTPESEGKPISPASVPSQTRSDRQMLPAAVSQSLTMLPYVTVNGSRFSTVSFALPPTVPIFQRDCSYLV